MSKPKFNRLRKLLKVVKQAPNDMFDLDRVFSNTSPRCAIGHARTSPKFAKQVKRHCITPDTSYDEAGVLLFKVNKTEADALFCGAGCSSYDKDSAYETNEGKAAKKVFKRRLKKFFAKHGKVL